jgi:tetratricopeptide (TPR) repeat protein
MRPSNPLEVWGTLRFPVSAICCVAFATPGFPQENGSWVGQTFIVKHYGIKYCQANFQTGALVPLGTLRLMYYRVEAEDAGFVKIHEDTVPGWVDKKEVVLLDHAVAFFTERIRESPTGVEYLHRAAAWQLKGDLIAAIADYDEAIRLDPNFVAFNNRGYARQLKKDYVGAIADYSESLRLNPTEASPFFNRGNAWSKLEEHDKAIDDFTEAIRLNGTRWSFFNNRGIGLG